jgi:hypothetical protein
MRGRAVVAPNTWQETQLAMTGPSWLKPPSELKWVSTKIKTQAPCKIEETSKLQCGAMHDSERTITNHFGHTQTHTHTDL